MKSKTTIGKQISRKSNPKLVETIIAAKKSKGWVEIAGIISSPRRNKISMNLEEIDKKTKEGDVVVVPGKILSQGDVGKKIKVIAVNFSEKAKEKLLTSKSEVSELLDEIKKNPEAKGIRILK